jgi:hypothetical protein
VKLNGILECKILSKNADTDLVARSDNIIPCRENPSVFRRNLQCKPVRGVNFREDCHVSHAGPSFTRTCVRPNGILECKFLPKTAHRTLLRTAPRSNRLQSPCIRTSLPVWVGVPLQRHLLHGVGAVAADGCCSHRLPPLATNRWVWKLKSSPRLHHLHPHQRQRQKQW